MTDIDYTSSWRDLNSIGYGLFIDTGYIYPMKESGGYEIENGLALSEADDLSMLSKEDTAIFFWIWKAVRKKRYEELVKLYKK